MGELDTTVPAFLLNKKTTMTANDQENIERKLNHLLDMGSRIIALYPHITCTERSALLLAMMAASRQVAANMRLVAALLRKNLLDPFRIDYTDYARRVENLLKIWKEELEGAPIVHNLDTQSLPITNPNDIALREDTHYDLGLHTDDNEMFNIRVYLMKKTSAMCEVTEKALEEIGKTLREIVADYQKMKADTEGQDRRLKELEDQYVELMWEDDKKRFYEEVEEYAEVCGDKTEKTYRRYLSHIEREATDPHDIKVLAELNEWYLDGGRPAGFIVEHRDKLTIEDLARHFRFVRCRRLLQRHVERFSLMQPADEAYKDLFVNQAAQELATLLVHTIAYYVDFRHNYQYVALQMAMQDLGLVFNDRNNGAQMRDFLNATYLLKDEKIKDQTTLTQWTGKLLGSMFGTMDETHLRGNYGQKDFEKLKDHYWLCLSIINKVVQLDLKELGFAPYLYQDHERTPNITDYRNEAGESLMDRLSELREAIRGVRGGWGETD